MTEPAKILTAEDVLTSIRRLLAQDGPVATAPVVAAVAEQAPPLVLTPDFRVAAAPEAAPVEPEPPTLEDTLAALEAALTGRFAAPAPEPVATPGPEPVVEPEEAAAAPEEAEPVEEAPFIAVDMPDQPTPVSFRHTAEIRRLQLVTPPEASAPEEVEEAGDVPAADEVVEAALPVEQMPETQPDSDEPVLSEMSAADPEQAITADADPEPSVAEAEPSLFDAPEEVPVSLEALHQIVGDILRQELQGALGERMTRNVRKLVRAEIRRALAEQGEI